MSSIYYNAFYMSFKELDTDLFNDLKSTPAAYCRVAHFEGDLPARRAYARAQELIFAASDRANLSAYRFLLEQAPHVAVLGERPPDELDRRLATILSTGRPATLPPEILALLWGRRIDAGQQSSWVEGHYQPGRRL